MKKEYIIGFVIGAVLVGGLFLIFDDRDSDEALPEEELGEQLISAEEQLISADEEVKADEVTPEPDLTIKEESVKKEAPKTPTAPPRDSDGSWVVTYTDRGFSPFTVILKKGEAIRFVNNRNQALWVTSRFHPTAKEQYYPDFDQGYSIAQGGSWIFVFHRSGTWGYKNLNDESHLGAVIVTE